MALFRGSETPNQRLLRVKETWPDAEEKDLIWIEPIGSRNDALIYWRKSKRVTTGSRGLNVACFEGTLDDLKSSVLTKLECDHTTTAYAKNNAEDYLAAIEFLKKLS